MTLFAATILHTQAISGVDVIKTGKRMQESFTCVVLV